MQEATTRSPGLVRLLGLLLGLMLAGCRADPAPPPPVYAPEATPMLPPGQWSCGGFADLDGDGTIEIVLVAPGQVQILPVPGAPGDPTTLTLRDPRGLDAGLGRRLQSACSVADFNADGRLDVVVVSGRTGVVALGKPTGFELVWLPEFPEADDNAGAYSATPIDADGDGFPDLYVARSQYSGAATDFYADGCSVSDELDVQCGDPEKLYRGPRNVLLRNAGGTGFTIVEKSGTEDPRLSQAALATDLDRDGRQDLVVANDAARNGVYLNRGNFRFEDASEQFGLTMFNHGMGLASGDLDSDGHADLVVSDIGTPLVLLGGPDGFTDAAVDRGFGGVALWSWGVAIEDFSNEPVSDILLANEVFPRSDWWVICRTCGFEKLPQPELALYRNMGERFFLEPVALPEQGLGENALRGGSTLAVADADRDGVLDALMLRVAPGETPDGDEFTQPWFLKGRLSTQAGSISVAVPPGARVRVCADTRCREREMTSSDSYQSIRPSELHFGLGAAREATVTVEYPHGAFRNLGIVPAGGRVRFER